jgi:hypothetical protein
MLKSLALEAIRNRNIAVKKDMGSLEEQLWLTKAIGLPM